MLTKHILPSAHETSLLIGPWRWVVELGMEEGGGSELRDDYFNQISQNQKYWFVWRNWIIIIYLFSSSKKIIFVFKYYLLGGDPCRPRYTYEVVAQNLILVLSHFSV